MSLTEISPLYYGNRAPGLFNWLNIQQHINKSVTVFLSVKKKKKKGWPGAAPHRLSRVLTAGVFTHSADIADSCECLLCSGLQPPECRAVGVLQSVWPCVIAAHTGVCRAVSWPWSRGALFLLTPPPGPSPSPHATVGSGPLPGLPSLPLWGHAAFPGMLQRWPSLPTSAKSSCGFTRSCSPHSAQKTTAEHRVLSQGHRNTSISFPLLVENCKKKKKISHKCLSSRSSPPAT